MLQGYTLSKMKAFILLYLVLCTSKVHSINPNDMLSILEFCENNGKRHLNIFTLDGQDPEVYMAKEDIFHVAKEKNSLYTRNVILMDEEPKSELLKFHQDSLMILASSYDSTNWEEYVQMMTNTKIMSSILVMVGELSPDKIDVMKSLLENVSKNSFFYWVYRQPGNELTWNRVLTIDNYSKYVINRLNFDPTTGVIVEDYDLQGLNIVSMTLSWAPFFTVENCKEGNKKCESSGYLQETMDILATNLNFTWESHEEPSGTWGTAPVSGPANVSGEWGGIFGYLMRHEYQISISTWVWNEGRNDMFDFIPIIGDRVVLIAKPQRDPIDIGLFIRPFQNEAWYVLGFTVAVIIGCLVFPTMFAPKFSETAAFKIVASIGWLLFMLTEIYYSGALTMFFSTEVKLPFETTKDVMQAYDAWKLMMQKGNDIYFIGKVDDGDPDYVAFWERKNALPEETVFNSVSQGVELMLNNLIVIQMQEGTMRGFVKDNPEKGQGIKLFDRGSNVAYNLIVVDNCPLGPALKFAARNAMETGTLGPVVNSWIGKEVGNERPDLEDTKLVLGAGQLVLIFFVLGAITFATLAVLVLEFAYKSSTRLQNTVHETNEFLEDFQRDGFNAVRRMSSRLQSGILKA